MEEVTGTKKNSKSQGVAVGVVVAMCLIGLVAYFAVDGNWFERLSKAEWCKVRREAQQGLYPYTSDEVLIMEALAGMDLVDLRIMRNEIYARHGYIFSSKSLQQYFSEQEWYTPRTQHVVLSDIEQRNVALIQDYENVLIERAARTNDAIYAGCFPFTSVRMLTFDDVALLFSDELKLMRNEIYARHGYIFADRDLRNFFESCSWYRPRTKEVVLSEVEKYNVNFIQYCEQEWYGGN